MLAGISPGCLDPEVDPTVSPAQPEAGSPDLRRESESEEFSGKLPATVNGIPITSGNSTFQATFERAPHTTMIELSISAEGFKAPGYNVTVEMENYTHMSEFSGAEPYVLHTGLRGPYTVTLRAMGPDAAGTEWSARVTQFYLVPGSRI